MYLIVAGLGGFGRALAGFSAQKGNSVAVIDTDPEKCSKILEEYDLLAIAGNATDLETLEEAGISQADAFVAATGDDAINLMACWIAKRYNITSLFAVVNQKEHESLFHEAGIKVCENRDDIAARSLLLKLENPDAQILASIEGGCLYEITVAEGSKGDGKTVREVSGSKDDLYVAVRRKGELIIPNGDVMFKPEDRILVFTKKADEAKSVERMKGLFGNN